MAKDGESKKRFGLFRRKKKGSSSPTSSGSKWPSKKKKKMPSDSSTLMTKDLPMPKYYEFNPNKPMLGLSEKSGSSLRSIAAIFTGSNHGDDPEQAPPITPAKPVEEPAQKQIAADAAAKEDEAPKASWLCRTRYFRNLCNNAFELIDTDGSGEVDEKELYSGLLLIHLKLGTMAGPAACKPLSRDRCHAVFLKFDKDESGYLDHEEFDNVMMVLFGNVLFRVVLQYAMTLIIVPFLAKAMLDGIYDACNFLWDFITELDEHSKYADQVELFVESARDQIIELYSEHAPDAARTAVDKVHDIFTSIPDSVWSTVPLTLTSAILGIMIVPWSILKMDDFFQYIADRQAARDEAKTKKKVT